MAKQLTNTILLVRPAAFRQNPQTAGDNHFQQADEASDREVHGHALREFDLFARTLQDEGVDVHVFDDIHEGKTPDSVFPNNWVSFHEDGHVFLYPMFAENRRMERRMDIIDRLKKKFSVTGITDLTYFEEKNLFLEATGSMVLDRENKTAYAALSQRTCEEVMRVFCQKVQYKSVTFRSNQTGGGKRLPVYHTNVMMSVGKGFSVVCLSSIDDHVEKQRVINTLESAGKAIIDLTTHQIENFAGNILHITGSNETPLIVMSSAALKSLNKNQIQTLEKFGKIVHSGIPTIERIGGGGVRCMMGEVFLPPKQDKHDSTNAG